MSDQNQDDAYESDRDGELERAGRPTWTKFVGPVSTWLIVGDEIIELPADSEIEEIEGSDPVTFRLTLDDADAITDYDDLRIRVDAEPEYVADWSDAVIAVVLAAGIIYLAAQALAAWLL